MFEWFLELDFATSTLDTLARKLDRYAHLAAATRPHPDADLAAHPRPRSPRPPRLTHVLSRPPAPGLVPVATSTAAIAALPRPDPRQPRRQRPRATPAPGPADPVWLPLTARPGRAGRPGRARPALARLARQHPRRRGRHPRPAPTPTPMPERRDASPPHPLPPMPPSPVAREHR